MTRLATGDAAPDFTLPTDTGDTLSLKDLRGRKVVLYAYPAAMTPGCTTQACDFRDSLASLQAAGYEVVGISPDKPPSSARTGASTWSSPLPCCCGLPFADSPALVPTTTPRSRKGQGVATA